MTRAIILGLLLLAGSAGADERLTTWRAGDMWPVTMGCWAPEDAEQVALAVEPDLFNQLAKENRCFSVPVGYHIISILVKWHSGPLREPINDIDVSIWLVQDRYGSPAYTWVPDERGPHPKDVAL